LALGSSLDPLFESFWSGAKVVSKDSVFAQTRAFAAPRMVIAAPKGDAVVLVAGATPPRSAVQKPTMDAQTKVVALKAPTVVPMVVVAPRGITAITVLHTTMPSGAAQKGSNVLEGNRVWRYGFEFIITRGKTLIPYIRGHCAASLLLHW